MAATLSTTAPTTSHSTWRISSTVPVQAARLPTSARHQRTRNASSASAARNTKLAALTARLFSALAAINAASCWSASITYAGPAATGSETISPPQNGPATSAATVAPTTTNAVTPARTSRPRRKLIPLPFREGERRGRDYPSA
jgi:hypothetical protein